MRFEGELIRAEAGRPIIARHERHEWHVDGEPYARLRCHGSIMVHFERVDGSRSRRYGPYESAIWAGRDAVAAVKNGAWSSMFTSKGWPRLRLVFAS